MMSFFIGAGSAAVLALGAWAAMDAFSQTSIERVYNPSLQLEGVDQQFGPLADTVPEDEIAG